MRGVLGRVSADVAGRIVSKNFDNAVRFQSEKIEEKVDTRDKTRQTTRDCTGHE